MLVDDQPRIKTHWAPTGRRESRQDYYVVREVAAEVVQHDYWNAKPDPDGKLRDRFSADERRRYLQDIDDERAFVLKHAPGTILDFGCGPGWLLSSLPETWRKIAVETSPRAVAECRARGISPYSGLQHIEPSCVDIVFCHHVIEHCFDPLAVIASLRGVLKKGGWLILGTPDFNSPCAQRFGDNYRMLHDPTHCSLFTLESCTRFLSDNGFTVHDVRFPFPTRYATAENFLRWNDTSKVSPPWPGNWMTFFCTR